MSGAGVTALPLAGVKVVEFVHMVMGPSCGLVLADLGAEVIKVEPPGGDNTRRLTGSGAGFFATFNRNKKSLAVDVKDPQVRRALLALIADADIVTENFRPGAMDKLGFGYEELKRINPDLIYVSHKGFLAGPYEHRTALDEVVQMMGGLAYMTGPPGRPLRAGSSVNDIMGGMFGAIGAIAALHQRAVTGKGQLVESALYENNVFLVAQHMMQFAVTGKPASPMPARLSAWGIYDVFDTADAGQLFVGIVTDSQWQAFCRQAQRADWAADARLASNPQRVAARDWLMPLMREFLGSRSRDELSQLCEAAGLPWAPIRRPEELFDDPHLQQSGGLVPTHLPDGRTTRTVLLPLAFDHQRLPLRSDPPRVGEHTRDMLRAAGLADEVIDELVARGVVNAPVLP